MGLLGILVVCGVTGGIGLVIGVGTGIARGRHGMARWPAILMAAFYPVLVFPVAGISVHLLLSLADVQLWNPVDTRATLQAFLGFAIAGLIAAIPSAVAAFFAHAISSNRFHAKQLGKPPESPTPPS